jgi:lysophospholipase L1-like esterase
MYRTLIASLAFWIGSLTALAQTPAPAPDLAKNPASAASTIDPTLPTLFIAGDSTAARGRGEHQQGWAVSFADYFDLNKVNIVNRARGGRSSRTFVSEGLWDQLLADVKAGDTVLIQFGHNDGGAVNDASRARGSLPGLGEETQEIDNQLTKKHEIVHTFGWYLRKMIADVKARGASPIVLSLTLRNIWADGKIERGSGRYGVWSFDIAKAAKIPFIDLTNTMADAFEAMGEEKVKAIYEQDHTHFNAVGADLHAAKVVAGLKGLRPSPVTKFLSTKGESVEADRFAWLRLARPANPKLPSLILVGDSTVRQGRGDGAEKQWGWGDYLAPYFDRQKVNVVNRAVGGTGVATFIATGYWEAALRFMKSGDVVMIQFGHNDNPPRGPLRGIGEETEERENPTTRQKETLRTWGWHLRRYITDIRAKGATPIICSLVPRKTWRDGKIARNRETFAGWAEQVARAENVAFVDLNELIARRYDELGEEKVNAFFADEHTHTSLAGAEFSAGIVVEALRALPGSPVAAYLQSSP